MNSFGIRFKITTFGESHGKAIGVIVDGVPAGLKIDEEFIQSELDRRKPGGKYATKRKEDDKVELLSGVFEGYSTGTPIAMVIFNTNAKSKDYSNIKDLFRPGHADFTYYHKFGIRDYRGGGRSSARETAARVAASAIAKLLLKELGIEVFSGVYAIGGIEAQKKDFKYSKKSEIFALDPDIEDTWKSLIEKIKNEHNSIGGVVKIKTSKLPIGLGEPLYYKLDAVLADALIGVNGVKAIEIGAGCRASKITGLENNDELSFTGFKTNQSGGILGGISNGEELDLTVYFKPTPSIFLEQNTLDLNGNEVKMNLVGRHDPCIAIRGSVVAEAMVALVLADMVLLNTTSKMQNLKKIYKENL